MNSFDDAYRLRPGDTGYHLTCESLGEHTGDPYTQTDVLGTDWERWTCCDTETPLED